jgi:DNA polymerase III, alpha subunit
VDLKAVTLDQIVGQRNGKEIAIAALIVGVRPMRSRKGARWGIYTVQDMTGVKEMLVFPETFTRLEAMLKPGAPLLLKVRIQIEESETRLSLQEARRLEDIADRAVPQEFRVRLQVQSINQDCLDRLESLFANFPGNCSVVFELRSPDGSVATLPSQQRVRPNPELVEAVRNICGAGAVEMAAVA